MNLIRPAKAVLFSLYRSWLLRILIALIVLLCLAYYVLFLPWLNRSLSTGYLQQTGHQLQHDKLDIHLFKCNINLNYIKDITGLWQADAIAIDIGCWQSLRQRSLIINQITIDQFNANPIQRDNGQWNFDEVIQHINTAGKASDNKTQAKNPPLLIKQLAITNSAIHSNLLALNNMPLVIAPLNLTLSNIDLRAANPTLVELKASINKTAPVSLSGQITLASLSGEFEFNAAQIPVIWFNPAIKPYVALEVVRGTIELHNHLSLRDGMPQLLQTSGNLQDLKLRPTSMEQDAVKWKSLAWSGAEVNLRQKSIYVPLLNLDGLDGQFIITKDRTTNVQAMVIKHPVTQAVADTKAAALPVTSPWQFNLERLVVSNAAIGFYDQSLTPSFSVIVQQFGGAITGISTDVKKTAEIHLAGNVDGYAPVRLDGKAKPFAAQPAGDAVFSFKQMDMGAFSPYSAEYAGWRIKKGLLSVDLNYHYESGKILGKNHVVLDHLEFGEKVRSTHAIDIPLRLALAMLTDENGIAILDTEISGAPSDPSFNLREVIWRALQNSVKKIITAPFRFLSSLISSKEDLGYVDFTQGESLLSAAATDKLKLLHQALQKRPKMRLSVQGGYDDQADLLALKEEQVKSALQKLGLELTAINGRDQAWAQAVNELYPTSGLTNSAAAPEQKYQEMIAHEVVDVERLHRLAHERAQAVKQYFVLQLGVASEMLLLDSEVRCAKAQCNSSKVIFTLED